MILVIIEWVLVVHLVVHWILVVTGHKPMVKHRSWSGLWTGQHRPGQVGSE